MANLGRARALIQDERFLEGFALIMEDAEDAGSLEGRRLLGLACLRMGRNIEAARFYEDASAATGAAADWFNLAMARLQGGDPVHAIIALEEARHRSKERDEITAGMMLFHFIGGLLENGMWDAAKRYLQDLSTFYIDLRSTADRDLFDHRLPYFSWFLHAVVTAYHSSNSAAVGIRWLENLGAKLDASSRPKVEMALRQLSLGESSPLPP